VKLKEVLESLVASRPISNPTYANYCRACQYFSNYLGRDATVSDLTMRSVNAWFVQEEERARYDASYIVSLRRDLLVVWNHAADIEACPHPKARLIRSPKAVKRKEPEAWPKEWVPRLIEASKKVEGMVRGTDFPRSSYAEAYFRAQFEMLCRPTDLRYLLWGNVSADGRIEWVQHKTGRAQAVRVSRETIHAMNRLRGLNANFVFPLGKSAHELIIHKVFDVAGIKKPVGQSLGRSRHTGGTEIAKQYDNDAARRALGHTPGSRVFERHYFDQKGIPPVDTRSWWEKKLS
jgi:hypothetical protein